MTLHPTNEREVLRHVLATLAYRGGKCLRDAPASFAGFECGQGRTCLTILAHLGDLLAWALSMAQGAGRWQPVLPETWAQETARFHRGLEGLDQFLVSDAPLQAEWTRLLQGPLADALTHVGQLAMRRRMAGAPIPGENYFLADIEAGRIGAGQAPPRKPF
jgi:hypothetical protein